MFGKGRVWCWGADTPKVKGLWTCRESCLVLSRTQEKGLGLDPSRAVFKSRLPSHSGSSPRPTMASTSSSQFFFDELCFLLFKIQFTQKLTEAPQAGPGLFFSVVPNYPVFCPQPHRIERVYSVSVFLTTCEHLEGGTEAHSSMSPAPGRMPGTVKSAINIC